MCFEHSGLLKPNSPHGETEAVCVTCSDEGRLGEVVSASEGGQATVRTGRGVETVITTLVDPVAEGDLVLVHAGTAISRLDEEEDV